MSHWIPEVGGFNIISEACYDKWHLIFIAYNGLSEDKAEIYKEENKKTTENFIKVKGSEAENLLSFVFREITDTKLLSAQLNLVRRKKNKTILSMHDIFQFLDALFVLKYTPKGQEIFKKVEKQIENEVK